MNVRLVERSINGNVFLKIYSSKIKPVKLHVLIFLFILYIANGIMNIVEYITFSMLVFTTL